MKPVIIFITLFSVSFGGSFRDVGALMESVMFYGNVNSSNVITDKYIGADTEFAYGSSYGIQAQLSSLGLKGRFNKFYLSLGLSEGGFLQKNIHQAIDYEIQKRYRIHYVHTALFYPIPFSIRKAVTFSGFYAGIPTGGTIETLRGGFTQPDTQLEQSYLKTDFGFLVMVQYNLNRSVAVRSTLKYGLNNSFDYTHEDYKAANRIYGIGISYRYNAKKNHNE